MQTESTLLNLVSGWHRELDALFALHQDAILRGALDEAAERLEHYIARHQQHSAFEDEWLLPALATLDDPGPWPAAVYAREHDKIRDLLEKTRTRLSDIRRRNPADRPLRAALIGLLDDEKTLKGVCAHHQEREEKGLLPALDRDTSPQWHRQAMHAGTCCAGSSA